MLEAAKRRGLLIGKGGLYANVLRIAPPPLTLTSQEAAEGLALLVASIEEAAAGLPPAVSPEEEVVAPWTSTVIRGGLVITAAEETPADVLIHDETVVALAATGSSVASWTADTEIDAAG